LRPILIAATPELQKKRVFKRRMRKTRETRGLSNSRSTSSRGLKKKVISKVEEGKYIW
jgi:ribosome-binding protein aMBF1 (putative translation factor)